MTHTIALPTTQEHTQCVVGTTRPSGTDGTWLVELLNQTMHTWLIPLSLTEATAPGQLLDWTLVVYAHYKAYPFFTHTELG